MLLVNATAVTLTSHVETLSFCLIYCLLNITPCVLQSVWYRFWWLLLLIYTNMNSLKSYLICKCGIVYHSFIDKFIWFFIAIQLVCLRNLKQLNSFIFILFDLSSYFNRYHHIYMPIKLVLKPDSLLVRNAIKCDNYQQILFAL